MCKKLGPKQSETLKGCCLMKRGPQVAPVSPGQARRSVPFIPSFVSQLRPSLSFLSCVLFRLRPERIGTKWRCIEISKTISQNHVFLLYKFIAGVFCGDMKPTETKEHREAGEQRQEVWRKGTPFTLKKCAKNSASQNQEVGVSTGPRLTV